jgi:phosphoribosylglycinamide formyltransferase-1
MMNGHSRATTAARRLNEGGWHLIEVPARNERRQKAASVVLFTGNTTAEIPWWLINGGCWLASVRAQRQTCGVRVVILGSGRGSNAEAILKAQQAGKLGRARVVQIFSDKPDAGILALGARFGVPADFLDAAPYKTKLDGEAEQHYIAAITSCRPDLIVLAGFMRVLKLPFLAKFERKIINLHPSLLPSFPGLDAIGQAWRRGVKVTGCTVHYVTIDVDGGPILDQATVRIEADDTLETLTAKVHGAEHELLPAVIARLSEQTG